MLTFTKLVYSITRKSVYAHFIFTPHKNSILVGNIT